MKKIILGLLKFCAALILATVVFVVGCGLFFFATSRFEISPNQLRWAIQRFVPSSMVELTFADLKLVIDRPPDLFFAKRIGLQGTNVCIRYETEAAITCVSEIKLGLTGGWGGKGSGEPHGRPIIPHLISSLS
jgi:hypothetical protein